MKVHVLTWSDWTHRSYCEVPEVFVRRDQAIAHAQSEHAQNFDTPEEVTQLEWVGIEPTIWRAVPPKGDITWFINECEVQGEVL